MVCGRGPSIGKKLKQAGRDFDKKVLQPIRPYAQEIATAAGTVLGGPLGASIGSTIGGLIEGQDFGDALAGGALSGITAGVAGATGGGGLGSFSEGVSKTFGGIKNFITSPIDTIKSALPGLSEVPDIAMDKIKAELGRLPENAMKAAVDMLRGADPSQLAQAVQQGGGVMDILGSIGSGVIANNAAKDILELNAKQFNDAMRFQRESRDIGIQRSEPFAQAGVQSLEQLQQVANQGPIQLDQTGTTLEEINPLVSFLRQQGFEDIQESAAAKGRLQSGGTLQDLTRFNTDLTSTIIPQLQQQKFNQLLQRGQFAQQGKQQQFGQLYDVARLGANAVAGQNTLGASTASNLSNLSQNFANTQASALANRSNVFQDTIKDLLIR